MGAALKYDDLSQRLSAAWPSQRDLDLLLSVPDGPSGFLLYKAGCVVYDGSLWPRGILRLPPPGSHPIIVARKLLLLSVFLQGALANPSRKITSVTSLGWYEVLSQVVEAARLVTANDELVASVEGIECLIMESMYYDAVGNLQRAWMAIRRAIAMAQMMGLHRAHHVPKSREDGSGLANDPKQMWFRLIQADRYISMMLGLPHGPSDSAFAAPNALEGTSPVERMRRLDVLAAGLILQRNDTDMHDAAATRQVDRLLQKSAASVPSQWWLPPNPALFPAGHDAPGLLDEVIRLMDQFVHYHLVVQLHLPYLLRSPVDGGNNHNHNNNNSTSDMYSKITSVTASRELLTRYVAFHQVSSTAHYCRGVDFLAFLTASTLCLAHLEASQERQAFPDDDENSEPPSYNGLAFLTHQRPSDRGLMEQAAAGIEEVAGATRDAAVSKMGVVLGRLLEMEEDAARGGGRYVITFCSPFEAAFERESEGMEAGRVSEDGEELCIFIPHFGCIEVKRDAQQDERLLVGGAGEDDNGAEEWALDGVDLGFESFVQGMEEPGVGVEEPWMMGEQSETMAPSC
jgi:hypothetical protein